ncbi:MAG: hypothetical protein IJK47_00195 [Lachnospiraceae bacterium]|nr:hypothetical protein [Lachnospiraceae bacterium]
MKNYYIASCVFTSQFPELSWRIQTYVRKRWGFEIVCYCHYCLEGLKEGGKDGRHLAEMLF